MKYKVGDKVRIKNKEWYEDNCNRYGILECGDYEFFEPMNEYCGEVVTITRVDDCYRVNIDKGAFCWTDEMFEGLVEEETPKFNIGDKVILDPYPCIITNVQWNEGKGCFIYTIRGTDFAKHVTADMLVFDERPIPATEEIIKNIKADWNNFQNRYNLPDDYHFVDKNGNEINISEIVLEKKKKEYPKTYEECYQVTGLSKTSDIYGYKNGLLFEFQKLLIAREAYWKIAGEEMGLGKPWEPDWTGDNPKYSIYTIKGVLTKAISCYDGAILAFPTEEMRDDFYENFKKEIEMCKELL